MRDSFVRHQRLNSFHKRSDAVIGKIDPTHKEVTVIGAGISGLLIADALKTKGYQVEVLESAPRVGGLLESKQTHLGLVECAAHSFLMTDAMVKHFEEIGITPISVNPKAKARYIYRNGKPQRMPLTFVEILRTLFQYLRRKPILSPTASFEAWGLHHLGEAATRFLIAPFVTGVFAATPQELDFRLAFPKVKQKEKKQMMTLPGGLESWALALRTRLHENIQLNRAVTTLRKIKNIVIATPAPQAANLLRATHPKLAELFEQIPYAPLITITVFAKSLDFGRKAPRGIGVLIPRGEGVRILGVLYNSSAFIGRVRNSDTTSLTVMLGGTTDPEALTLTDSQIEALLKKELNQVLGWSGESFELHITRWKNAIPIYGPRLRAALDTATAELTLQQPGLLLCGNWTGNVSLRGILSDVLTLNRNL